MVGCNLGRSLLQEQMKKEYKELHIGVIVYSNLQPTDSLPDPLLDLEAGELPYEQATTCQSLQPHMQFQSCFCGVLIACFDTQATSFLPCPTKGAGMGPSLTPLRRTSACSLEALSPLALNGEASIKTAVV